MSDHDDPCEECRSPEAPVMCNDEDACLRARVKALEVLLKRWLGWYDGLRMGHPCDPGHDFAVDTRTALASHGDRHQSRWDKAMARARRDMR